MITDGYWTRDKSSKGILNELFVLQGFALGVSWGGSPEDQARHHLHSYLVSYLPLDFP